MTAHRRFVLRSLTRTVCLTAVLTSGLHAQERGPSRGSWRSGVVSESWRFSSPLPVDSGSVDRVSQAAFPLGVSFPLGSRWSADLSGAYTIGSARVTDSIGGTVRDLSLSGPTDVKLRVVGRLVGDAVVLTGGVNAPTGLTKLAPDEVNALRLIGSPVLRMPSPTLGSGFGATAGLVVARQIAGWAVAAGASYESRASYSPVDAAAASGVAVSDLNPSDATHLTLGADRLIGQHRLSLLGSYDVYGRDQLTFADPGGDRTDASFKLGPTIAFLSLLELGVPGMQELSISFLDRYRSSFTGIDGLTAEGSSGNSVDARLRARWGAPGRLGFLLGAEGRFDTGLDVDESLATAAGSAVGATLGISIPIGGVSIDPAVRYVIGTIDTGAINSSASSLGFTITLGRR